eukprot:6146963-Prymnesium_polylepis.1
MREASSKGDVVLEESVPRACFDPAVLPMSARAVVSLTLGLGDFVSCAPSVSGGPRALCASALCASRTISL